MAELWAVAFHVHYLHSFCSRLCIAHSKIENLPKEGREPIKGAKREPLPHFLLKRKKKRAVPKTEVAFSELFFGTCLLIFSVHLLLHLNVSISVFPVPFVDTDVGITHSMQMQVRNWKMLILWMFGKWSLIFMRLSWYSVPEHRRHRFDSSTENTGMWLLTIKERTACLP